ncbi:MAG: glycosyltransferase [Bacteroidetes bacterium]|nr:glycosyltransferase [Bacteroidota bacterium]
MPSENINVTAVVVTYNRLDFLKEIINAIRNQTKKTNNIIVVDNSSTDGTSEWLVEQQDIIIIRQDNVGSSGGQFTGIKAAYDKGGEWIWTMDDDVVPDLKCLELLLEKDDMNLVRVPLRHKPDGEPFLNDVIHYNLSNPLKKFWQGIITENHLKDKFVTVEGITFEGPLFHRSVVERIGLPEKKFFIFADDTEYFLRVKKFNIKIELCRDARLDRKLEVSPLNKIQPSKKFYFVRNLIAVNVLHGSLSVRLIRPFIILFLWIFRARSFSDLKYIFKGFIKGYFYKSGN